jgi:hypothetical protein
MDADANSHFLDNGLHFLDNDLVALCVICALE